MIKALKTDGSPITARRPCSRSFALGIVNQNGRDPDGAGRFCG
jgi:hypothetical protein